MGAISRAPENQHRWLCVHLLWSNDRETRLNYCVHGGFFATVNCGELGTHLFFLWRNRDSTATDSGRLRYTSYGWGIKIENTTSKPKPIGRGGTVHYSRYITSYTQAHNSRPPDISRIRGGGIHWFCTRSIRILCRVCAHSPVWSVPELARRLV